MTQPLIIDSSVITIPIAVRDKDDPDKLHEHTLHFDISDKALKDVKERQAKTQEKIARIRAGYGALFDEDGENVSDDNIDAALTGLREMLSAQFDADYGAGEYDTVSELGGGNSIVNMIDLYMQVNEFVDDKLELKFAKLDKKSAQRKAKYLKKHGK